MEKSLKHRTAGTLKWNTVDRVATQLLYAITGVVLARVLSQEDFGLVGAVLVFQAFATLLVDSGFNSALVQRKHPSQLDYSSVLWFNIAMGVALYAVAWVCAPLIAGCFGGDERLVPLTRVMFLAVPLNATATVQSCRLVKRMDVKMVAVANSLGLVAGAIAGISLALTGAGAWAIVWQTLTVAAVKSATLWATERWRPSAAFSMRALRSYMGVGTRVLLTSFLNTVFQNIYSFFVGNRVGLASLGYYTQGDKWSKMGVVSISQVLTASFLPTLSEVQDDPERFRRMVARINRFTGYMLFPATLGLAAMATPIFHTLFGTKWDASIVLFQMLLVRGVFTVLNSQYSNYVLSPRPRRGVARSAARQHGARGARGHAAGDSALHAGRPRGGPAHHAVGPDRRHGAYVGGIGRSGIAARRRHDVELHHRPCPLRGAYAAHRARDAAVRRPRRLAACRMRGGGGGGSRPLYGRQPRGGLQNTGRDDRLFHRKEQALTVNDI